MVGEEADVEILEAPDRLMLTMLSLLVLLPLPVAVSSIAGCESIHVFHTQNRDQSCPVKVCRSKGHQAEPQISLASSFTDRNAWDRVPPGQGQVGGCNRKPVQN